QQVSCAIARDQMAGEQRPEHTRSARDQHRACRIKRRGHSKYQFAHVTGAAQESIGIRCLSDVPRTRWNRAQFARLEQLRQLAEHPPKESRSELYKEIKRSIVTPRMPPRAVPRVSNVCFPHLNKPPPGRQAPQQSIDNFFFEKIDYTAHPRPASCQQEL